MQDRDFRRIETNGITLRAVVEGEGPLVVFVHGWPESWYSWRHQIDPVVSAGHRVCAIDVRGYGESDCPEPIEAYAMTELTADVAGLVEALGEEQAVLVGHDWGAPIVWQTALLHPARVRAVCGLSVPHLGRGPVKPMEMWKQIYQDRFFYQLYFQEPGKAEAELEADIPSTLRRTYYSASGDAAKLDRTFLAEKKKTAKFLDGMIDPDPLPDWLSQEAVDYYASQFEKAGFRGGLNRYRNQDRDWEELPQVAELEIEQPALFIAGELDPVLAFVPGVSLLALMDEHYTDLRGKVLIEGAGHWVQQERPDAVNRALLDFFASLDR
jgi:pimeloyl-ACP methyl ester carboxylesterase